MFLVTNVNGEQNCTCIAWKRSVNNNKVMEASSPSSINNRVKPSVIQKVAISLALFLLPVTLSIYAAAIRIGNWKRVIPYRPSNIGRHSPY